MFKKLQVSSVHDVIKQFIALPEAFDQLLKLSHIFITFPFSSASTERFFSALKRVNNCVRGTMNTERLSNLLVICTESSFVKTVDQNKLVDNFGNKKKTQISSSVVNFNFNFLLLNQFFPCFLIVRIVVS